MSRSYKDTVGKFGNPQHVGFSRNRVTEFEFLSHPKGKPWYTSNRMTPPVRAFHYMRRKPRKTILQERDADDRAQID